MANMDQQTCRAQYEWYTRGQKMGWLKSNAADMLADSQLEAEEMGTQNALGYLGLSEKDLPENKAATYECGVQCNLGGSSGIATPMQRRPLASCSHAESFTDTQSLLARGFGCDPFGSQFAVPPTPAIDSVPTTPQAPTTAAAAIAECLFYTSDEADTIAKAKPAPAPARISKISTEVKIISNPMKKTFVKTAYPDVSVVETTAHPAAEIEMDEDGVPCLKRQRLNYKRWVGPDSNGWFHPVWLKNGIDF